MEIELGVVGSKQRETAGVDGTAYLRMNEGVFAVVVPHYDDWLRTDDFDLRACRAIVHLWRSPVLIEFQGDEDRQRFAKWLVETDRNAEKGYKTMYP